MNFQALLYRQYEVTQLVETLRYKSIPGCVIDFFFIDIILPAVLRPLGLIQTLTEMSTRNISWG